MPELPEVETFRKYLEGTSLKQKITGIEVESPSLVKPGMEAFEQALVGRSFKATQRIGKYLFVETDSPTFLILHFGMTGWLSYFKDDVDQPRYTRVQFEFDTGFQLAFVCRRKLGWVNLTSSVETYQIQTKLGPDALAIPEDQFRERLGGRKSPVKPRLLDQKILAGVGNWIADEMLYQAAIHPETTIDRLTDKDWKALYEAMKEVLQVAVDQEAVWETFPAHFLTHQRDQKEPVCHYTGEPLKKYTVGGRPTYISTTRQKKR